MPGFRSALDVIHFARGARSNRAGTVAWIVAGRVYWAKIPGFAFWPARNTALFEEVHLESITLRKASQVPMTFFEKRTKRAWVNESAVKPFTFESLIGGKSNPYFDRKLFGSNPVYRQAVIEGARLLLAHPDHAPDATSAVVAVKEMIRKYEPDFPGPVEGSDLVCSVCAGSTMSGELRVCCSADREGGRCGGRKRIHYHCLEHNCPLVDVEKRWFCNDCGQSYGWAGGALLPADPGLVPFFGTVNKVRPPSAPGRGDQLYHVLFEDGDTEEYDPAELRELMGQYDAFRGPAHNRAFREQVDAAVLQAESVAAGRSPGPASQLPGSCVGARVSKFFAGELSGKFSVQRGSLVGPFKGALSGRNLTSPSSAKTGAPPVAAPTAQLPDKRKLVEISHDRAGTASVGSMQSVIKKKARAPGDEDDDVEAPAGVVHEVPSLQPVQEQVIPQNPGGQVQVPHSQPVRSDRCVLASNVPIVAFFDQCLAVMARHEAIMERARRRTLDSHAAVTQDSVNQLVENMAGDLINAISQRLGNLNRR